MIALVGTSHSEFSPPRMSGLAYIAAAVIAGALISRNLSQANWGDAARQRLKVESQIQLMAALLTVLVGGVSDAEGPCRSQCVFV